MFETHHLVNVTIVDRDKSTRKFPNTYLKKMIHELAPYHPRVVFFEYMPFHEQVRIVQTSHIMIMRHGAGEANLLFGRQNSLHIEVNSKEEMADRRSIMYHSVSRLAKCQHISVQVGTSLRRIVDLEMFQEK